ncbi:MAG: DUF6088 family protein [Gammaproteobacteria bacterium]|nr:DUF6088 family protein [Gammaproteobacteria bacterium]
MDTVNDTVERRIRSHARGAWVGTPADFADLREPVHVQRALDRLLDSGEIRRIGRDLYDRPYFSFFIGADVAPDINLVLRAIERRDATRLFQPGEICANALSLTDQCAVRHHYLSDGPSFTEVVGRTTIEIERAPELLFPWLERRALPVVTALLWLGPAIAEDIGTDPDYDPDFPEWGDENVEYILHRVLDDATKHDFIHHAPDLPAWAQGIAARLGRLMSPS